LVAALAAVILAVSSGSGGSHHVAGTPLQSHAPPPPHPKPAPPPAKQAPQPAAPPGPDACLASWNAPANAPQQHLFAAAANDAGSGTTVADHVFVTRYSGMALTDVGEGESGINVQAGDCLVAHAANVVFAQDAGAWHKVGVSPETGLVSAAVRAAKAPNARVDLATGTVTLVGATP
jgi:hypothetical protein